MLKNIFRAVRWWGFRVNDVMTNHPTRFNKPQVRDNEGRLYTACSPFQFLEAAGKLHASPFSVQCMNEIERDEWTGRWKTTGNTVALSSLAEFLLDPRGFVNIEKDKK